MCYDKTLFATDQTEKTVKIKKNEIMKSTTDRHGTSLALIT